MADTADHAWAIAVAAGNTPLPPHSPPLRHSGGGLNVAARHILLALYLHHRDLHLPDPQLPDPPEVGTRQLTLCPSSTNSLEPSPNLVPSEVPASGQHG